MRRAVRSGSCIYAIGALLLALLAGLLSGNVVGQVPLTIRLEGVSGAMRANVLAYLSLERLRTDASLTDRWVRILHRDADEEIKAALAPFGYYNVAVDSALEQIGGRWRARYRISPGDPVRISGLDLRFQGEGKHMAALGDALSAFPLKRGDQMDDERYETGKSDLLIAARRQGFARAELALARVLIDPALNTARIVLHIETGPRYYIGQVRFHQDFLNPDLLERTVTLTPGAPYVNSNVLAFQQGLQVSDWAAVVAVDPRFDEAVEGRVPIDVTLQASKRHRFRVGAGYETNVGPRVSARWLQRRINESGHHAEASAQLSSVRRNVRGTYFVPVRHAMTDRLATGAEYEFEKTTDTRRKTFNGDFGFVRRSLDERRFNRAFLEYRYEQFQVDSDPSEESRLLSLGYARQFTELNFEAFPQRGQFIGYELRGGSSAIFSDISYARITIGMTQLLPLGVNGRFRLSGDLGFAAVEDFEQYPTSLRFFAGGDNSIRGYEFKSLGPEDEDGNVVGGENLLVLSGEYNHRVKPGWAVAGFVDGGNAYNDRLDDVNIGAGVGFRWLMNFGSLRVDFAWPVSDEDVALNDVFLHLGFGAAL